MGEIAEKPHLNIYKRFAFWVITIAILVCIICAICFVTNPAKRISLREAGVVMPENVQEISVNFNSLYSFTYTDEKKISRILKYLNSMRLSPETISEVNYYLPVTPPEEQVAVPPNFWLITLKSDDGTHVIYIRDDLSFGFVKVELPANNPVIRFWNISQRQFDKLEPLLRSTIPDKLPRFGHGYEEWTEGLSLSEAYGLKLNVTCAHATGCTLIFDNSLQHVADFKGTLQTDMSLELEVMNNDKWEKVKSATDNEWGEYTYSLKKFYETRLNMDWKDIYGELPEGHYRIHKVVTDYVDENNYHEYDIYAEFDITESRE